MQHSLKSPLVDVIVSAERAAELKAASRNWPSLDLAPKQVADLELLMVGAYSPLAGFLGRADYESVHSQQRLVDGTLWPAPITLDVAEAFAKSRQPGEWIALREPEGLMLAALEIGEIWESEGSWHLAGKLEALQTPRHYDFTRLRLSPNELPRGNRVIAFVAEHPMNLGEFEATQKVVESGDANLLLHAAATDPFVVTRCLQAVTPHYHAGSTRLALRSPSSGVLLRAIVERNYGCTDLLATPEEAATIEPYQDELGIRVIRYQPDATPLPFPEIERELERAYPPRKAQGFTIFFTGLSGAGKSTIANILRVRLLEHGGRKVTLLDGDLVRKHLSSELGFSPEHRDINIRRIGYVASEITRNGGAAICAPIAPYRRTRQEVREMIRPEGGFILVYLDTPVETCESRDVKGLYAKARAGLIDRFTGISDPYEIPDDAEITLRTAELTPEQSAEQIMSYLQREGYL